jgi:hypothetical protein
MRICFNLKLLALFLLFCFLSWSHNLKSNSNTSGKCQWMLRYDKSSYWLYCNSVMLTVIGPTGIINWQSYKGESKIIFNVDTRCAVGYTAGWAWCDMCGLLVSYCCGALVTLEVHSCHEFCIINLDSPLFICTKEEQRAVIGFFMGCRCTRCQNA